MHRTMTLDDLVNAITYTWETDPAFILMSAIAFFTLLLLAAQISGAEDKKSKKKRKKSHKCTCPVPGLIDHVTYKK